MPTDPIAALLGGGGKSSRKAANPLAAVMLKQARPKSDKRKKKPPTPQELEAEEGLIREAGSHTMSALAWLGGSLDKAVGGRAIRTLLGKAASGVSGKPGKSNWRDLASVIPFSDTLGITNPYHDTGGRQILEQANMLKPNRPGLDWGDVGGFAAEVLTDPGTYLTGGTKTLAGQLMAKVGAKGAIKSTAKALKAHRIAGAFKTPKTKLGEKFNKVVDWARSKTGGNVGRREADVTTTINDILSNTSGAQKRGILRGLKTAAASKIKGFATMSKAQQRAATRSLLKQVGDDTLGKSFGLGLPFMEPFLKFGGGENARRFAEVLDWPAMAAFNTKKGAALRGLFVNAARGAQTPKTQARMEPLTETINNAVADDRLNMAKGYRIYSKKVKKGTLEKGMGPAEFDEAWRATMETVAAPHAKNASKINKNVSTAIREDKIRKLIKLNFPDASASARKWIEKQYRAHRKRTLAEREAIISKGGVMDNNEAKYMAERDRVAGIRELSKKLKDPSAYNPGSVSNAEIKKLLKDANELGLDTRGWVGKKGRPGVPPHEQKRAIDAARLKHLKSLPKYTEETYTFRQASDFDTQADELADALTPVAPLRDKDLEARLRQHIADRKKAANEPRPSDRQVREYQIELLGRKGYHTGKLAMSREKLRDLVFEERIKEAQEALDASKKKMGTSPRVEEMNEEIGLTRADTEALGATPRSNWIRVGGDAESQGGWSFRSPFSGGPRPAQTRGVNSKSRNPMLSQIPGGTVRVSRESVSPKVSGPNAELPLADAIEHIKKEVFLLDAKDEARLNRITSKIEGGVDITEGEAAWLEKYNEINKKAEYLADYMRRRSPLRSQTNAPLFGNDPYSEIRGISAENKAVALSLDAVHDVVLDSVTANPTKHGMPTLEEFYSGHGGMGMDAKQSIVRLARKMVDAPLDHLMQIPEGLSPQHAADATDRAIKEMSELRRYSEAIVTGMRKGSSKDEFKAAQAAVEWFKKLRIDPDEAKSLTQVMDFMHTPEILKPWTQFFDKMLQVFKGRVTSGWPAFLARNVQGLLIQELMEGGSPIKLLKYFNYAADMLAGKEINGASKWARFAGRNLTDRQATDELADRLFSVKVGRPSATELTADVVGRSPQAVYKSISNEIVGEEPIAFSAKGIAKHVGSDIKKAVTKKSRFKRFVKSVLGGRGSFFQDTPDPSRLLNEKWGEEANEFAERIGRIGTALREMAEGATQQVAGEASGRAHVVYDQLTPFERQWMRRLLPFYSYMRGTVPKVLRSMATNPKGFPAQAAKTEYRTTRGDVVPRQIVGAIPIGGEDDTGNRRYLKVDLPFSQINDLFAVRPTALGTVKATGQGLLSMLRPGMKGVLEAATGQSFFQRGRPLTDLFSTTGTGLPLIDTIAMNTPASRVISTASMLRDPRKGAGTKLFNLLSGTRLSDVNLARERDTAIRDLTNEMLRGQPGVRFMEDVYIPKGQENLLSPRNRAIFDLVKNRQYRKAAEKRAEAKKSAPPKKKKAPKSKDPLAALLKSGR